MVESTSAVRVTLAAAVLLSAVQSAVSAQVGTEDPRGREEWYWSSLTYPFAERPYAQLRAVHERGAELRARAARSAAASTASLASAWHPLGPFGLFGADNGFSTSGPQLDAGRVAGVAPDGRGNVFIATASGGVWRSSTLGTTWIPATDDQCSLNIGAIAVDPAAPNVVYAGTGEYNATSIGCGMLRSTDGGVTWTALGASSLLAGSTDAAFAHILIDRSTAGSPATTALLAATDAALFRSTNGGQTWAFVITGNVSSVVQDPAHPDVMFAGDADGFTRGKRGVYRSADHGITWAQLPPLPDVDPAQMGRIELAMSPAAPDALYALVANRTTARALGLFRWDDAASTWTQLAANGLIESDVRTDFGAQGWYDLAMQVDPRDANRIYLGGVRAFRSTDGGANFAPMGTEIHVDWHALAIDPVNADVVYAGTDGGVFISYDGGDSWTSRNQGLQITQYYPGISMNPSGTVVLGGSQDNGTSRFSGSLFWDGINAGDGGFTAIDASNPQVYWTEMQWDARTGGAGLLRHTATGETIRRTGIAATDRAPFIPPFVLDPATPTTLYFGTYRLYRTIDDGASWTPISGDLSKGSGTIATIAVAPTAPSTIYVGTSDGNVQVSRDGGATFAVVTSGLPNRAVSQIVVDRDSAAHAFVAFSGFSAGHVFETHDAGASWRDITASLPDVPAYSIVLVGGTLIVGTEIGVFQTMDDGTTWASGPPGLPNAPVRDLAYQPLSRLLVAATYGRGMWQYAVGGEARVLRGDVNGDGKLDAFDALLIEQALVSSAPQNAALYPAGDANCNGKLDAGDLVLVLRAAVGLPTTGACVGTVK
ncbi:MAG: dockerin type I domain-containing protein [Deltaproteobacteria bacterium]